MKIHEISLKTMKYQHMRAKLCSTCACAYLDAQEKLKINGHCKSVASAWVILEANTKTCGANREAQPVPPYCIPPYGPHK